jgi:hypothetical protein
MAERAAATSGPQRFRVAARLRRADPFDIATAALLAGLAVLALATLRDYAISNDEAVQHHYGELILAYYASGGRDRAVFAFENLYLYGGLFDMAAVALSRLLPFVDTYDLRHALCAWLGLGGLAATAATARAIAGPRAGFLAALTLAVCGVWWGAQFNHTKDIPFAAAMMAAIWCLVRVARRLPAPRPADLAGFGLFAGAALGQRVLGLLLLLYAVLALAIFAPAGVARARSVMRALPALALALVPAYALMVLAWPWAALAPLNPLRGLLAFSEFQYEIRTLFAGRVYDMADVPRFYVPIYLLIRLPLLLLAGATLALVMALPGGALPALQRRAILLLALTVAVPLACHVAFHGPAFTGLRHFLFVVPPLAALAGLGLDRGLVWLDARGPRFAVAGVAAGSLALGWTATTLVRLHPYENLFYNSAVGGLQGASRRYDLDYWFAALPEALGQLEAYVRAVGAREPGALAQVYSVAVCGERPAFDKAVTLPQLRWDFRPRWEQSDFFLAPTHMNCDADLDGTIVATVERLGVPIAYVKDRRQIIRRATAEAR